MIFTNRFERKFLIEYPTYKKILEYIDPFVEKDSFFAKSGRYLVNSLYFDTYAKKFYWEKVEGEKERRKIRIRSHLDAETGKLYKTALEVKKKDDLNVFKEKVAMSFKDAYNLVETGDVSSIHSKLSKKDKRAVDDAIFLKYKYGIKPEIIVCYERQAFYDKYNPRTRLTFDFNVRFRTTNFNTEDIETENYAIPPYLVILELKYNNHMPVWLTKMIQVFSLRTTTISKYCESVNNSLLAKDF